ncbi:MAG: potassium channel protein [Acidobacteriota bacterium]|nr:potassium channel protein [Acidobacteriota bacterium]
MDHVRRRLIFIASAIVTTLLGGTIGFMLIEHYSPFDAFYFTLITITTVGYSEMFGLSHMGRIFNSFLIFFGVTTMLLAMGGITQTVIELELNQFFGKRRIKKMIDKLEDHYIVCGFGRIGRGAAMELQRAGVPFIVVDKNEDKVEMAIRAGMLGVLADVARDEALIDVGIMRSQGLIATLSTDADNLFLLLSAKGLKPELKVCARLAEEASEQKFRRAGADFVFAPYGITGNRMAQALLRPHVFQFIDFTTNNIGLKVGIEQVLVGGNGFDSRSLAELQLRRELGVIVLAIRKADGSMLFNPGAEAEIQSGDFLVVMGESDDLRKLEQLLSEVKI